MNFLISRQLLTSYIITNELNSCLHCGTSTEFYVETCSWQSAIGTIPSTVTTIQWRPNSSGARYYVTVRGGKVKLEVYTVPQVKSKTICFSSLTYISTVLNGLHQGEWPLQASHTIIT